MNSLKNKNIVIGVCGGIAIYKVLDAISRLRKAEANVHVIMTKDAQEFIKPLTFMTMSNNPVHLDIFDPVDERFVEHIHLAKIADAILIAPATANTIAKIANGFADNLLTATVLATKAPVILAPGMNSNMLNNPATIQNLEVLKSRSFKFLSTNSGFLACGDYGDGRMAEGIEIYNYLDEFFTKKDLAGMKVLVSAGPTIAPIDPVRYITNHSSGKMGYAIAKRAKYRGAEVVLLAGKLSIEAEGIDNVIRVDTADEMFEAAKEIYPDVDAVIMSAAVSDYKLENVYEDKMKKTGDDLSLKLIRTPDILKYLGEHKTKQILVGFAAETKDLHHYAKAKIESKNLDFIVANNVKSKDAGFGHDTNIAEIIFENGENIQLPKMQKVELADIILDNIKNLYKEID